MYSRSKRAILPRLIEGTRLRKTPLTSDSNSPTLRRRGRRALQYLLVFVGCVLVLDALVGEKGLLEMLKKRQEYRTLEQSIANARTENAQLREEARRLREDPAAIEDLARRDLGLIKPGEKLFIVKDVAPADSHRPK
ncbi:MAG TPA: septum formation initiator family protein [Vicinamibacterales bacterium]|nr:septum formation initiator family protein [Vicinamibacterales bacterium]